MPGAGSTVADASGHMYRHADVNNDDMSCRRYPMPTRALAGGGAGGSHIQRIRRNLARRLRNIAQGRRTGGAIPSVTPGAASVTAA
jgi:hypothetical protein